MNPTAGQPTLRIPCSSNTDAVSMSLLLILQGIDVAEVDGREVVVPWSCRSFTGAYDIGQLAIRNHYGDDEEITEAVAHFLNDHAEIAS